MLDPVFGPTPHLILREGEADDPVHLRQLERIKSGAVEAVIVYQINGNTQNRSSLAYSRSWRSYTL